MASASTSSSLASPARGDRGVVRLLIDECLSVDLVAVAAQAGHEAHHRLHLLAHLRTLSRSIAAQRIAAWQTSAPEKQPHSPASRAPQSGARSNPAGFRLYGQTTAILRLRLRSSSGLLERWHLQMHCRRAIRCTPFHYNEMQPIMKPICCASISRRCANEPPRWSARTSCSAKIASRPVKNAIGCCASSRSKAARFDC
jgi:hypothetical protein